MDNLKQIAPYLFEIPKTGAMRVPGRVYATRELMESQKADEAIQQVRNVAHLPGIVGHALAMPDFHWGYGFPIGGVAAFDEEEGGVISPGGVGYDINCLEPNAKVLSTHGYTRPICEIVEERQAETVASFALSRNRSDEAKVVAGFSQRPRSDVLELVTNSGRKIVASEDHPFLTPGGMTPLGAIGIGGRIAVCAFEGVPYERPSSEAIVSEANIRRVATRVGKTNRGNGLTQALRSIHSLLPLRANHPAFPTLLKVAGYVLGDGSIHFERSGGKGVVTINGKADDLRRLAADLKPWVRASRVYSRERHCSIHTTYGKKTFEHCEEYLHIRSTGFALLLASLGVPIGRKASQDWGLPGFLPRLPLWQQRLFIAGYFGAELSTPKAFSGANHNFYCPEIVVVKREGFVESGERFLSELARRLEWFGIQPLTVLRRTEQMNPDGSRSVRLRLVLSNRGDDLVRLWTRVGFEYNQTRFMLGLQASAYLQRKKVFLEGRSQTAGRALEIRQVSGWGAKKVHAALATEGQLCSLGFVVGILNQGPNYRVRANRDFPKFAEWLRSAKRGLGRSGMVWEEVAAKTPRNDIKKVYDITVDHPDHNFVANGFVVHNCGVRLIRTNLDRADVQPKLRDLVKNIFRTIPAGVGSEGAIKAPRGDDAIQLVTQGAKWAVYHGFGTPQDLDHIEDGGLYPGADPKAASERAFSRGMPQVGTLGSGNHFLEIQVVDQIYRKDVADHFGLKAGTICFSIHSGSRGFGYQVCDDFLKTMMKASRDYGIELPDRQLCCAPLRSPEAKRYLAAMGCAANYAWVNRQVMTALTRRVFAQTLAVSEESLGARLIYDVCHNIAKFEEHGGRRLCVHRKGATRAFGPGHPLLPEAYRDLGQPTFIPGDMGRASFLLIGKQGSMRETFGSTCHGAGRAHSRNEMKRLMAGRNLFKEMEEERGVIVMAHGRDSVAEEMPEAYKDASLVVDVMEQAGVTDKVARLRPIGCVKG